LQGRVIFLYPDGLCQCRELGPVSKKCTEPLAYGFEKNISYRLLTGLRKKTPQPRMKVNGLNPMKVNGFAAIGLLAWTRVTAC
jgi:hypothetical protein